MSLFALVHGGGLGAWCWDKLRHELNARGHGTTAVDLGPEDFGAGAAHCAQIIEESLPRNSAPVLVGHSIAGLIVPLVPARRQVRKLVFLHALLPQPGRSVVDQLSEEPDMFNPAMFETAAPLSVGSWQMTPIPLSAEEARRLVEALQRAVEDPGAGLGDE